MIRLTVPQVKRLPTGVLLRPCRSSRAGHWLNRARSRWYHQRARLARDTGIALVS
jgi:hypothetical protein